MRDRGPSGVRLVISDNHRGLVKAVAHRQPVNSLTIKAQAGGITQTPLPRRLLCKSQVTDTQDSPSIHEGPRSPHPRTAKAAGKTPPKTRLPRSERFCLGMPGGAGGTRTQMGDASRLRKRGRAGR
ncbi:hypothetical protein [Streptomyces sp. NPDC006289]|uniref:hypothetical protein n=1 Tax=Streptomyces sp. NPDC006289 TaxID=3156744 RepID=UPI0033A2F219